MQCRYDIEARSQPSPVWNHNPNMGLHFDDIRMIAERQCY